MGIGASLFLIVVGAILAFLLVRQRDFVRAPGTEAAAEPAAAG